MKTLWLITAAFLVLRREDGDRPSGGRATRRTRPFAQWNFTRERRDGLGLPVLPRAPRRHALPDPSLEPATVGADLFDVHQFDLPPDRSPAAAREFQQTLPELSRRDRRARTNSCLRNRHDGRNHEGYLQIWHRSQGSHPFSMNVPLVDSPEISPVLFGAPPKTLDPAVNLVNGSVECTTCHQPHFQNIDKIVSRFLVRESSNGSLCLACHDPTRMVNGQGNYLAGWSTSVHATATNGIQSTPYVAATPPFPRTPATLATCRTMPPGQRGCSVERTNRIASPVTTDQTCSQRRPTFSASTRKPAIPFPLRTTCMTGRRVLCSTTTVTRPVWTVMIHTPHSRVPLSGPRPEFVCRRLRSRASAPPMA